MTEIDGFGTPFLRQLLAVTGVVLYMIGTGANIAFPGVLLQQLRQGGTLHLTAEHESWIASILGLALITGIIAAPFSLQALGRRRTNQISTLPTIGGWALMAAAGDPIAILVGRSLQGFGMGLQAASAPLSIAEYTDPKHRGAFLATIAFSFATGMLLAHVFGTLLFWRTAAIACGSVYVLSLIFVTFSPETPPYLASKGRYDECKKAYHWLRGYDEASERELEILLHTQTKPASRKIRQSKLQRLREIVGKPEFYKPTVIMMFMFVLFQISGMTVVPSYTVPLMNEVTAGSIGGPASMLIVDSVRFFTAILACYVAYKCSRRNVLFFGITVTVLSLFTAASLLYLRDFGFIPEKYKWVPVIPTLVYIFGKTLGILPIPWAIAGEVFPLEFRSLGGGISGMFLSLSFFVVVKTAPKSFEQLGVKGTFLIYGMFTAICGIFLFYLLPETKGKTLYEIECHFKGIKTDIAEIAERGKMIELDNVG